MDNHEAEKKIAWEAELESHRQLAKDGAKEFFAKEFPDLKHAFLEHLETVCCMDEGTAHKDLSGEAKFTLAGSGILYPAASEEERLQKVVEKMKKNMPFLRIAIRSQMPKNAAAQNPSIPMNDTP